MVLRKDALNLFEVPVGNARHALDVIGRASEVAVLAVGAVDAETVAVVVALSARETLAVGLRTVVVVVSLDIVLVIVGGCGVAWLLALSLHVGLFVECLLAFATTVLERRLLCVLLVPHRVLPQWWLHQHQEVLVCT